MTKLLKIAAFAASCGMLALAQPVGAANGATTAAVGTAAAAGVEAKAAKTNRVCLNVIPDTGSRVARRICNTKAEWADQGIDLDPRK